MFCFEALYLLSISISSSSSDFRCFSGSSKKHYPTVIEERCRQFSLQDLKNSIHNFDHKLLERFRRQWFKGCLNHNGVTDHPITLRWLPNFFYEEFKREITMLCQLRHPNIVSLIGFCNHKYQKILVFDYLLQGSLKDRLYGRDMEPMSWKKRLEICIGIARGLHYLHARLKRSVVHHAVTPNNIHFDTNMVPKISGFEHSLQGALSTAKPKPIVDTTGGQLSYLSPENMATKVVTDKCDVYSFGKVLLEMVCTKDNQMILNKANMLANQQWGQSGSKYINELIGAFEFCQVDNMVNFVRRFPMEEIIDLNLEGKIAPKCWQVFVDIIQGCLKYERDDRPTMGEVEVLFEHALSLQEEADLRETDVGDYTLLSTTYINRESTILIDVNDIEELTSHQFSLQDLRQTTSNFIENHGLVKLNGPTCPIEVKRIDWSSICAGGKQWNFEKEIAKICQLRHPNLVSLLGFCDHDEVKALVYPYFSLRNHLYYDLRRKKDLLTWKKRLEICIGISQGLDYLHTATIFHGNIKLINILLDVDMVPKLRDFGLPWSKPKLTDGCAAPEWSKGHDFTDKCDVYSFGIILLQMVFKMWRRISKKNIYPELKGKIAPRCWEAFQDITRRCLKIEASERPTMKEVETSLQNALALQEEADANTNGHYNLLSTTAFGARIEQVYARINRWA